MGRAEELFSRIEREGLAFIDALIADRASEELFLEFKRSADDGQGTKLHDRDRGNLRKAISGFANSEGGVVLWGIDCSKCASIGDVASARMPISSPSRFVSWIEGAISGCTVPPVVGVRSMAIAIDSSTGIVATYVPKSPHAPHQVAGEGKYLIRAGSDFVTAPHGVVAGLFGHSPQPIVFPNFVVSPAKSAEGKILASATIMLVNNGAVVAEDLYVSLLFKSAPSGGNTLILQNDSGWPSTSSVNIDLSVVSPREIRLAPGGFVKVLSIFLRLDEDLDADLSFRVTAGCKGAMPFRADYSVRKDDLMAILVEARQEKGDSRELTMKLLGIQKR
nr:ATP-binding protein [Massilia sp. TS11]